MDNTTDDINLWDAFLRGDREAFGILFSRHYAMLYQYGSKISRDTSLVEDCIQELFSDLWNKRTAKPSVSIKAYLLTALKYKIIRQSGKNRVILFNNDKGYTLFELSHEDFLIEKDETQRKMEMVSDALNKLSARQKEIVYLKYYQNLRYDELSVVMDINYQAARNLLYQAIKSLKKVMENISLLFL